MFNNTQNPPFFSSQFNMDEYFCVGLRPSFSTKELRLSCQHNLCWYTFKYLYFVGQSQRCFAVTVKFIFLCSAGLEISNPSLIFTYDDPTVCFFFVVRAICNSSMVQFPLFGNENDRVVLIDELKRT